MSPLEIEDFADRMRRSAARLRILRLAEREAAAEFHSEPWPIDNAAMVDLTRRYAERVNARYASLHAYAERIKPLAHAWRTNPCNSSARDQPALRLVWSR